MKNIVILHYNKTTYYMQNDVLQRFYEESRIQV